LGSSLESMGISSAHSLEFECLWGSVSFEHSLGGTTSSGEVTKAFILPVSPWSKLTIKSVCWTCYFVIALLAIKACTKFSKN
jgi:hypothetical protein